MKVHEYPNLNHSCKIFSKLLIKLHSSFITENNCKTYKGELQLQYLKGKVDSLRDYCLCVDFRIFQF